MGCYHKGHYREKHPAGAKVDADTERTVRAMTKNDEITCDSALKMAHELGITPGQMGMTLDLLDIRLVECRLGLFGFNPVKKVVKPANHVCQELEKAIRESLTRNRLSCADACELAERLGKRNMDMSSACEALGIKICSCQLGAF